MPENNLRPIAVIGPTASGKSALGLVLAHELDGEVVNVDSMQLYRGMDIGTAKLTLEEREGIPHHQLDVWDVTEPASVARYQRDAVADVEDILARGKTPILVGGSMLYVQALVDDWQFPPTDPSVRAKYEARRLDIELTGKPFKASQPPKDAPPRWGTRMLGLRTTPEWLNPRIDLRTRQMFERGLVAEVEALQKQGLVSDSTAGRAIGYAQVFQAQRGELTWDEAVERTITGTRRYVRRQRSWFNRDPRITWLDAAGDTAAQARAALA